MDNVMAGEICVVPSYATGESDVEQVSLSDYIQTSFNSDAAADADEIESSDLLISNGTLNEIDESDRMSLENALDTIVRVESTVEATQYRLSDSTTVITDVLAAVVRDLNVQLGDELVEMPAANDASQSFNFLDLDSLFSSDFVGLAAIENDDDL